MTRPTYIALVLTLLSSCGKAPIDWETYYESQYSTPFGTKIMQEQLEDMYPDAELKVIKKNTQEFITDWYDQNGCFVYINTLFYPDALLYGDLKEETLNGNSLFIATEGSFASCFQSHNITQAHRKAERYKLQLHYLYGGSKNYTIENRDQNYISYFTQIPTYAKILGTVELGDSSFPNFIALTRENETGTIFLHANPELFSNYHLLHQNDASYSLNTFSYLREPDFLLWDGYGTKRRYTSTQPNEGDSSSLLRYISANKSLKYGFGLLLLALVLFFAVNYKRVTRSMPIHLQKDNTSVSFMKLIAGLFVDQENHIDLAKYRANYLLDRIKEQYYVDIESVDEDFLQKLSLKTSYSISELKPFMLQLKKVRNTNYLNQEDFIRFCKIIEPFIQKLSLH